MIAGQMKLFGVVVLQDIEFDLTQMANFLDVPLLR